MFSDCNHLCTLNSNPTGINSYVFSRLFVVTSTWVSPYNQNKSVAAQAIFCSIDDQIRKTLYDRKSDIKLR